ncbi:UDP-glucose dehydrogenase family protein [Desulfonema magnum]|uniref:UDP-glucose 6-dehydrogenase n=1 Tax=Desulfonema magnum TaxID=45655 RepID=A0A975GNW9_9BACT|nr:nucleotide sugar dehydrogenase [Desulfonema magnum]QTA88406.1 UDP-glucose 6-dehydrogenase [Desulfonema magnum]
MKIIVAGTGYVGLVHAAVCSEYGHEVYAYDNDVNKINAFSNGQAEEIEKYVNEPGLVNIIKETLGKYLFFSTDLGAIIEGADAIFLCLPTPPNPNDGSTNLVFYDAAVEDIAEIAAKRNDENRIVFVNKSTVPIGTARHLQDIMNAHEVKNFGVSSNPEFLAEGTAVEQARKPDRVVVGCDHESDFKILRRVYSQFVNHVRIKYIETTPETAEAIKYVANTMLLTYISFWNGVGAKIGERFPNVKIDDLRLGVTSDDRISTWGSFVSNGAGGSCFGKDIASLIYQLRSVNVSTKMLEASYEVNEYQKVYLVERAIAEAGFKFNNKTVAVLGLAFKKHTNDMRDASSIKLIESLLGKGVAKVKAYDPLAIESAKHAFSPSKNILFEKIEYYETAKEAIEGSHALFISTDWEEFRGLSRTIEEAARPPYLVMDGRRMIPDFEDIVTKGYTYLAVGAMVMKPE